MISRLGFCQTQKVVVFCGVRNHLEFLDGIHDRRNGIGTRDRAVVVQAVHQKQVAAVGLPIDGG